MQTASKLTALRIASRDNRGYSSVVPHSESPKPDFEGSSDFCRVLRIEGQIGDAISCDDDAEAERLLEDARQSLSETAREVRKPFKALTNSERTRFLGLICMVMGAESGPLTPEEIEELGLEDPSIPSAEDLGETEEAALRKELLRMMRESDALNDLLDLT